MYRLPAMLMMTCCVVARAEPPAEPVPDPPELPAPVESGKPMEPDVTIIRRGDETIEEYRINNKVYKVKIQPVIGPPYYLMDTDGDGNIDVRRRNNEEGMRIPQWVLFSW